MRALLLSLLVACATDPVEAPCLMGSKDRVFVNGLLGDCLTAEGMAGTCTAAGSGDEGICLQVKEVRR